MAARFNGKQVKYYQKQIKRVNGEVDVSKFLPKEVKKGGKRGNKK